MWWKGGEGRVEVEAEVEEGLKVGERDSGSIGVFSVDDVGGGLEVVVSEAFRSAEEIIFDVEDDD